MPNPFTAILFLVMLYCSCFALSVAFRLLYFKKPNASANADEECTYKIIEQPPRRRKRAKPALKKAVYIRGKIVNDCKNEDEEGAN